MTREKLLILTVVLLFCTESGVYAQTFPIWQPLPSAPVVQRHNDVYFLSPELGWVANGLGQIYRTTDGGLSWQKQFNRSEAHFRSVGFLDSLRGWAGNVGPGEFSATDSAVFYRTSDGGAVWSPVHTFIGPKPRGLCGMYVVNDSVICAVGRVRGPSFFARTTDRGETWISKDMSSYAAGLIDVYFPHPDTGFAVGLTNTVHENSSGVILFTSDGGENWEPRFVTSRTGEWCWKISFPSPSVGYVSLQRNSQSPIYFLKTTNGGATWQEKLFSAAYYFVQGIGFVNELVGWVGGNSTQPTYGTTDGGETWFPAPFGVRVNRLRFLSDTLGYAVGESVYKYSISQPTTIASDLNQVPETFVLEQNYPNPFNPSTTIRYELTTRAHVVLKIYNLLGQQVETLVDEEKEASSYEVEWDAAGVATGVYFYRLLTENFTETRKLVVLR